jgi:hypothetical protein
VQQHAAKQRQNKTDSCRDSRPCALAQPVTEADPEDQQQKRQVHVNVDPGDSTQLH